MAEGEPDTPDTSEGVIAAVRRAYQAAAAAIAATPDPNEAFTQATELANLLRELADAGAELRAQAVARIWESEQMSLSTLAQRIGVSKARADQLIKAARPKPETEE
jgi:DNA-binding transcriptional regulator YiaG